MFLQETAVKFVKERYNKMVASNKFANIINNVKYNDYCFIFVAKYFT